MSKDFEPCDLPDISPDPAATPPQYMQDIVAEILQRPTRTEREFVSVSPWWTALNFKINLCAASAPSEVPITITGPSGTGKEIIARRFAIAGQPFVSLNMAALPPQLVTSVLFGHVKGAFTGATENMPGAFLAAGMGTLFLDEIGELPADQQAMLLRVLEERTVTKVGDPKTEYRVACRIVCATNRDIENVKDFREDLAARLLMLEFKLLGLLEPERAGDMEAIAERFGLTAGDINEINNHSDLTQRIRMHNVRALKRFAYRKQYLGEMS